MAIRPRVAGILPLVVLLSALPPADAGFPGREDPSDRIGVKAPPLALSRWIGSAPLEPNAMPGKVVLVRWWTDTCPFCAASAPALRELHERYAGRGLVVIAVFHPKPPGDWSLERARRGAERLGLPFPLALDGDWSALRRWWLDHHERWTSVSFLVDKRGVIRYVHPGGEFHRGDGDGHWADHSSCNQEYAELERTIAQLLDE